MQGNIKWGDRQDNGSQRCPCPNPPGTYECVTLHIVQIRLSVRTLRCGDYSRLSGRAQSNRVHKSRDYFLTLVRGTCGRRRIRDVAGFGHGRRGP